MEPGDVGTFGLVYALRWLFVLFWSNVQDLTFWFGDFVDICSLKFMVVSLCLDFCLFSFVVRRLLLLILYVWDQRVETGHSLGFPHPVIE